MSGIHFKMCQNFEIDLSKSLRFKIQIYGPFVYSAKQNLKHRRKHPSKRLNTSEGINKKPKATLWTRAKGRIYI